MLRVDCGNGHWVWTMRVDSENGLWKWTATVDTEASLRAEKNGGVQHGHLCSPLMALSRPWSASPRLEMLHNSTGINGLLLERTLHAQL